MFVECQLRHCNGIFFPFHHGKNLHDCLLQQTYIYEVLDIYENTRMFVAYAQIAAALN